ncbi:hypothetical protein DCM75_16030 [Bradyrhizobium sp. WBOS02]|uniref:Uncharacterized protein n=1 Tax=Bradyrhizobium betae TaxID=244734 RepID=A0AAE9N7M1_9BRAD|nr:hypothetical protein DCK84_15275 [Bradyrhizobium sp. WBOS01]UUO42096.1 hypothetical protein DCM75_16030 [Bradyrhizobium sp. WBOS02]UUO56433.1 hypothetical protein DCM79_27820 [Bradyrhizobium sp. WBOS07]UUO66427.1 hypothetical protein DCM83_15285 [Bradyrhizobium betae]
MRPLPACWRRFSHPHRRHAPRKRGIQYAAAHQLNHNRLGVPDRPVKPGDDIERVARLWIASSHQRKLLRNLVASGSQ